jgi:transcriptional regulator with XRE-family HTH domain
MYTRIRRRSAKLTKLRNRAGCWLRDLREKRGLSQRELARKVSAEYHTFISQLENGRARIPPDRYLVWAEALGIEPREFVRGLMSYYDPVTYDIIFAGGSFVSFLPQPASCLTAFSYPLPQPNTDLPTSAKLTGGRSGNHPTSAGRG